MASGAGLVVDYLRRLVTRAAEVGAHTTFLSMPLNQRSSDAIPAAHREGFMALVQALVRELRNFAAEPERPIAPDDHFGDSNHLNLRGAALLSDELRARLGP